MAYTLSYFTTQIIKYNTLFRSTVILVCRSSVGLDVLSKDVTIISWAVRLKHSTDRMSRTITDAGTGEDRIRSHTPWFEYKASINGVPVAQHLCFD